MPIRTVTSSFDKKSHSTISRLSSKGGINVNDGEMSTSPWVLLDYRPYHPYYPAQKLNPNDQFSTFKLPYIQQQSGNILHRSQLKKRRGICSDWKLLLLATFTFLLASVFLCLISFGIYILMQGPDSRWPWERDVIGHSTAATGHFTFEPTTNPTYGPNEDGGYKKDALVSKCIHGDCHFHFRAQDDDWAYVQNNADADGSTTPTPKKDPTVSPTPEPSPRRTIWTRSPIITSERVRNGPSVTFAGDHLTPTPAPITIVPILSAPSPHSPLSQAHVASKMVINHWVGNMPTLAPSPTTKSPTLASQSFKILTPEANNDRKKELGARCRKDNQCKSSFCEINDNKRRGVCAMGKKCRDDTDCERGTCEFGENVRKRGRCVGGEIGTDEKEENNKTQDKKRMKRKKEEGGKDEETGEKNKKNKNQDKKRMKRKKEEGGQDEETGEKEKKNKNQDKKRKKGKKEQGGQDEGNKQTLEGRGKHHDKPETSNSGDIDDMLSTKNEELKNPASTARPPQEPIIVPTAATKVSMRKSPAPTSLTLMISPTPAPTSVPILNIDNNIGLLDNAYDDFADDGVETSETKEPYEESLDDFFYWMDDEYNFGANNFDDYYGFLEDNEFYGSDESFPFEEIIEESDDFLA